MNGFFIAVSSFFRVFNVVHKYRLWSFYYLPLIFNLVLYLLYHYSLSKVFDSSANIFLEKLYSFLNLGEEGFWVSILSFCFLIIKFIVLHFVVVYTFQFISLLFLSPLYSLISESLLNKMNNSNRSFNLKQFVSDVKRGIGLAFRNLFLQLLISVPVLLLSFIFPPIIFFGFIVSAYFYGFSMIDYRNEYYNLSIKDSINFIRQNKGFAIGVGTMYLMMFTFLSSIGMTFVAILFVPVICIVASVIGLEKMKSDNSKK